MTPPEKCEALRRAHINVTDLKELDELSSEATIVHKRFNEYQWQWIVTVTHDVLPFVAPGLMSVSYSSVYAFNKMIESKIAAAIAGEQPEATASGMTPQQQLQQYLQALQYQQSQYQNSLQRPLGAQGPIYTGIQGGITTGVSTAGLAGLWPPTSGSTTP